MRFGHAAAVRRRFATLAAGVLVLEYDGGPDGHGASPDVREPFLETARERLDGTTESALPEIQAWRHAFAAMGLKPTQYRCASEALLRRLRKDGALPRVHPLVDLANAASVAWAIPVAVLDRDHIAGDLIVRPADGSEDYLTFAGEHEHPDPGEIVFIDDANNAHARRWTNRQSGLSALRPDTRRALVVAEALHDRAHDDVDRLVRALAEAFAAVGARVGDAQLLTGDRPVVELDPVARSG